MTRTATSKSKTVSEYPEQLESASVEQQGYGEASPKPGAIECDQALSSADMDSVEIVHSIAGRVRFRIPEIKWSATTSTGLIRLLSQHNGIEFARANSWCGSLVVQFDPGLLCDRDVRVIVLQALRRIEDGEVTIGALDRAVSNILTVIERIPVVRTIFGAAIGMLSAARRLLDRSLPPLLQLGLGVSAFAASCLSLPARVTYPVVALSIAPIASRAIESIVDERKASVDTLDAAAAIMMLAHGKTVSTAFMTMLIALGEFIREQTARKCEKIVADLLGMAGQFAWLVKGKRRICIPANEVKVGDVVVVYPGELVPVDGAVLGGAADIDQSKLTGEFVPVEVSSGSHVFASTVNVEGKVYVRCTAVGTETRAGAVIESLNTAPLHETRVQNYASVIADRMVLPIFAGGLLCLALTRDLVRTMSVLIFDFTTGIRISAPTAVLSSMHRAGRHGILVKSGGALEKLASLNALIFDKTGTLTSGEPHISRIVVFNGIKEDRIIQLAAAVEQRLQHPASRAILRYAQAKGLEIPERIRSQVVRGMGARASVEGLEVLVGSKHMLDSENIDTKLSERVVDASRKNGESVAYIAVDGQLEALIAYNDQLRPEALETVEALKKLGVKKLVMATGDNRESAERIAELAGIDTVYAQAFPEQKADLVKSLREEGYTVGVIGDGINDSPALAHADVAISLHGGTEAARHSADLVLTDDDLRRLPEAIRIARSAMRLVSENITLSVVPNAVGLGLAGFGFIGPAGATLLNNGSAICSGLNALRPLISSSWSKEELDHRDRIIEAEPELVRVPRD